MLQGDAEQCDIKPTDGVAARRQNGSNASRRAARRRTAITCPEPEDPGPTRDERGSLETGDQPVATDPPAHLEQLVR